MVSPAPRAEGRQLGYIRAPFFLRLKFWSLLGVSLGALAFAPPAAQAIVPVASEIVLILDNSGSIDIREWQLQVDGYIGALGNSLVRDRILATSSLGGVALRLYAFNRENNLYRTNWAVLQSAADINNFIGVLTALRSLRPPVINATDTSEAMRKAIDDLLTNDYGGTERGIDVSFDGFDNQGSCVSGFNPRPICREVQDQRDRAQREGIRINSLGIEEGGIFQNEKGPFAMRNYGRQNIVTDDGTAYSAKLDGTFVGSVTSKLLAELPQNPVPGPLSGLALAPLVGATGWIRKRRSFLTAQTRGRS